MNGLGDGFDIGDFDIDLNWSLLIPELESSQYTADPDYLTFGFIFQVEERLCSDSDKTCVA